MTDPNPSGLRESCLLTLRYFGIFRYPLTLQEIHRFNPGCASENEILATINTLLAENIISRSGNFYLPENKEEWAAERLKGNERALGLLGKSSKYAGIIASFPFVRGIAISGSLSKFYASEHPDIDYFVITAADRLWIARSLLHLFKKLTFITGHQHYFCMNYFVDMKALKITHPNLYTAIEVATLLPVYDYSMMKQFLEENSWVREYLPNHPGMVNRDYLLKQKKRPLKNLLEGILNLFAPAKMNHSLMKLTDKKWRRKWKRNGYPEKEYDKAFLTNLHISKNHPVDYEKKVLSSLLQDQNSNLQIP
jgi:hypothetical protein